MNIFHKVALQGLLKSYTRTIVTIIGVVLSAAMITGVATFGISLLDYMVKGAVEKYGNWHVEFYNVHPDFVQEQMNAAGVASAAAFENVGYAALNGSKNPDKPYLFIAGCSEEAFDILPINLLSGRMPVNSSEVVISGSIAVNGGVKIPVGETVTLTIGERMSGGQRLSQHDPYTYQDEQLAPQQERTYTVVGICQRPSFEETSAPGYTVLTKADADVGAVSATLFVTMENPRKVRAYADSIPEEYAYSLNNNVLRFMGISTGDQLFNMILYAIGVIVIVIIMIGSIFLIYNAFHISLNERTHQFGILLSVGATESQLRGSVLFEGLCIGAVGIPIGVFLGIGGIDLVLAVVSRNFGNIMYDNVPLTLTISIPVILAAAVISLITILISAYIPARKAASTPVMECIRQTNEVKVEAKAVKTRRFVSRIYGLEGMLALKNFKRNKKRYRSIVMSLVLSVVLFISANSFVTDLQQASEMAVIFTTYDIGLAAHEMEDGEMLKLYDTMKTANGVYESSYQAVVKYACTVKASELSDASQEAMNVHSPDETAELSIDLQFLDDAAYLKKWEEAGLPEGEAFEQNANLMAIAKIDNHVQRVLEPEEFVNIFADSSMDITISPEVNDGLQTDSRRDVKLTFVDIVGEDVLPKVEAVEPKSYVFTVMAPWSLKDKLAGGSIQADSKGLTFRSKTSTQTAEEMEKMIMGASVTADYTLYNCNKMFEENSNMIFIANVFAYVFIIMISLIAAANVFNTISTNIKLRRRELAMLRSVGMSERDFQKMMNFECIFYGMQALLIGLPIALLASWLIYKGMRTGGADEIDFVLPWASIGISVVSVLFIVFVTMLYSISKIKKENIIDALRDDMA